MTHDRKSEVVVLVHGLCGSRLDMYPLARRLEQLGFTVSNWGYWSPRTTVQKQAQRLSDHLSTIQSDPRTTQVHLVGHSMGAIIIRAMLAHLDDDTSVAKLRRLVMLAPPNRGSHTARRLAPWLNWLAPSLSEISDAANSYVNQLPNSPLVRRLEFGIVQASKDRVIHPHSVPLDGQTDFACVQGHHGFLAWYPKAIQLVEEFLIQGRFGNEKTALA